MLVCSHVAFGFLVVTLEEYVYRMVYGGDKEAGRNVGHDLVLVGASLAPDVFDKTLFLAKIAPCSRWFGHTLAFAATLTGGVLLSAWGLGMAPSRIPPLLRVVVLGLLSHLLGDALCGFVPAFAPWGASFLDHPHTPPLLSSSSRALLEAASLVYLSLFSPLAGKIGPLLALGLSVVLWLGSVAMSSPAFKQWLVSGVSLVFKALV